MNTQKYREITYSDETCQSDFYTYHCIKDLEAISEKNKLVIIRCRTIGILHSEHGKFYITDIVKSQDKLKIRVSVIYLKTPLQSTIIPYPVQIFGTLQWHNRPVIFARILQTLSIAMAIRMRNALSEIDNKLGKEITGINTEYEEDFT